jgi:glutathionylspermidine synthase
VRTVASSIVEWGYDRYQQRWLQVVESGREALALDVLMHGWRYLSLNAVVLSPSEAEQLRTITPVFGRLLSWATRRLREDPDWWAELAWPWPAVELARGEPDHADDLCTAYGRFDWLLDPDGVWKLVEFNGDTPSGGREVTGLEPAIVSLHNPEHGVTSLSTGLDEKLRRALTLRLERSPGTVGVVSSHGWLEDMSQARWVAELLGERGLVGDMGDLAVRGDQAYLRGQPLAALYRFYPIERLYRHGLFGSLLDLAVDRRLNLLNGLNGFLAQSKLTLAYLWLYRDHPDIREHRALIERHLPPIVPARHAEAEAILPNSVVKHVNGREGQEVVPGSSLNAEDWEARLLDGGYTVQARVEQQPLEDVAVDDLTHQLSVVGPRYACIGSFLVGGEFGGCYTRLGGVITQARSTFVPTLVG